MRIKIIKRAEQEKIKEKFSAGESKQSNNGEARRAAASTIKFWIEDLRQKRERERLSVNELFGGKYCT